MLIFEALVNFKLIRQNYIVKTSLRAILGVKNKPGKDLICPRSTVSSGPWISASYPKNIYIASFNGGPA